MMESTVGFRVRPVHSMDFREGQDNVGTAFIGAALGQRDRLLADIETDLV